MAFITGMPGGEFGAIWILTHQLAFSINSALEVWERKRGRFRVFVVDHRSRNTIITGKQDILTLDVHPVVADTVVVLVTGMRIMPRRFLSLDECLSQLVHDRPPTDRTQASSPWRASLTPSTLRNRSKW